MSRRMSKRRARLICAYALKNGMPAAAMKFGMSKQRVSIIFRCHKSTVLFDYELFDEDGNMIDFRILRQAFAQWCE